VRLLGCSRLWLYVGMGQLRCQFLRRAAGQLWVLAGQLVRTKGHLGIHGLSGSYDAAEALCCGHGT
jgi:hypothetical protein